MPRSVVTSLLEAGVDAEELRLFSRTLARQLNIHAERRLSEYRKQMPQNPKKCEFS